MNIGIGGVSRSGKSLLAQKLQVHFGKDITALFDLDKYTRPSETLPVIHGRVDWEQSASIDWKKLMEEIQSAEASIIIVEGIFAFEYDPLTFIYDFKINIDIAKKTFLTRRLRETRWGSEPLWYLDYVWNTYQARKRNFNLEYLIHLDGDGDLEINQVLEKLGLLDK